MTPAAAMLLPLLVALALTAIPERWWHGAVRPALRIGGAALSLLLTALLVAQGDRGVEPWLGRTTGPLVALLADLLFLAAVAGTAEPPPAGRTGRLHDAAAQGLPPVIGLAALAADPLTIVALAQLALLLTVGGIGLRTTTPAVRRTALAAALCLVVALMGAALLQADEPRPGGLLLALGFGGLGLLAPGFRSQKPPLSDRAAAAGLVVLALGVLLRLRITGDPAAEPLLWAGIAWLLAAAAALSRLSRSEVPAAAAIALCGAGIADFGLGGAAIATGSLMIAASLIGAITCALADRLPTGGSATRLAPAALGLLPPFGVCLTALLSLSQLFAQAPLAATPAALGLALVALSLVRRPPRPAGLVVARRWMVSALLIVSLGLGIAALPDCQAWLMRVTAAAR